MKDLDILVVDDERDNLCLLMRIFEQNGMIVHCAASGEEALVRLKERPFAVMLTDFTMPGMDGMELARRAKKITPDLHIVMLTGSFFPGIARMASEAGISMVLTKPFRPQEILLAVIISLDEQALKGRDGGTP